MSAMDKKIKTLMEVVPRLDESEARRLLEKAGGSVNKASDMALEGGEWSAAPSKKKPVAKKEDKTVATAPRRDDKKEIRPRRDFTERKPREDAKVETKKPETQAPTTVVVVSGKSKVETGVSFADMIKRQKQQAEPVVETAPEPVVEAAPAPKEEEEEVAVEVAPETVVEEPVAAPAAETPKPKKERKEPKKKAAPALPQKYEAEIDRVAAVNLPPNIVEAAKTSTFTFSSEPGRAPTPPRQQQQIQQQQQQIHHQQIPHQQIPHQQNEWSHHARQQQQQQPVQRNWNNQDNYGQQRNQHFSDWRQRQGYDSMSYNNRMGNQQQQYRQDAYNNNITRPAQPQPQPNQAFW